MGLAEYAARWLVKKYTKDRRTYCFCPGCGLELVDSKSWYADSDLVIYRYIQCGHESKWLFDSPVPILLKDKAD